MTTAKFTLDGVTIEGFKAFTTQQSIDVLGKNLFLFGDNGCGKSSIIEAIRWCLFGLAERPDTEVRNTFYPKQECRVELKLKGPDGQYRVVRRLRPGTEAGRSDITIFGPDGSSLLQSAVFPHMARLGPKEGTHIIFAAQQLHGRRPQADISEFDKVLYAYLHLEEVPELLQRLRKIIEEQTALSDELATEIDDSMANISEEESETTSRLDEILRNRPWGDDDIPTRVETRAKVRQFASELASLVDDVLPSEERDRELLRRVEGWVRRLADTSQSDMTTRLAEARGRATELELLRKGFEGTRERQTLLKASAARIEADTAEALDGRKLDELQQVLLLTEMQLQEAESRLAIAEEAITYCRSFEPTRCPVCQTECSASHLLSRLEQSEERDPGVRPERLRECRQMRERIELIESLQEERSAVERELASENAKEVENASRIAEVLGLGGDEHPSDSDVAAALEAIRLTEQTLEESLRSGKTKIERWKAQVERLRTELRFHSLRDRQEALQQSLSADSQPAMNRCRQLAEVIQSVNLIRETISHSFNEVLDLTLPPLSNMITEVYQRLTNQRSFELAHVIRQESTQSSLPNLYVRVGSSRIPGTYYDPEDVLNGQALSALSMVPYFVFSKFRAEVLELDLLLIDDPSQSFDTGRVRLLLQELATAASHAQLVVATHEVSRFKDSLGEFFPTCAVVRVEDFDPERGPRVVLE
jgi:DNA repair exonuclease SbcCD ATPase subunit